MIFLDMDGVVADFVGAACKVHGKEVEGVDCWNFFEKWGISEDEFWEPVNAGGRDFWANLEPFPWFDELVSAVKAADKDFFVLTKPSRQASCLAGKLDWIHRHFGSRFRNYIFAPDKSPLAAPGRLLIDDSDDNVKGFREAGGVAYLFPQPWNASRQSASDDFFWLRETLSDYSRERESVA